MQFINLQELTTDEINEMILSLKREMQRRITAEQKTVYIIIDDSLVHTRFKDRDNAVAKLIKKAKDSDDIRFETITIPVEDYNLLQDGVETIGNPKTF